MRNADFEEVCNELKRSRNMCLGCGITNQSVLEEMFCYNLVPLYRTHG